MNENIQSKRYVVTDESGKLSSWEFERRQVADNNILINKKQIN